MLDAMEKLTIGLALLTGCECVKIGLNEHVKGEKLVGVRK